MTKREAKVVVKLGQITPQYAKLVQECRGYFEPAVTRKLKEGSQWKLKDYIQMAKDFHSSHIFAFSQSEQFNNLKVASLSDKGKTFYFKIEKYLLSTGLEKAKQSPQDRTNAYFVVSLGIDATDPMHELVQELKDNIKTTHMTTRVLMIKKTEENRYLMSHYVIRKEEKKGKANLIKLVLVETGPRMDMHLQKIEEGVCSGNVVYHTYIQKTAAELAERQRRIADREREKQRRKAEQEENVQRKKQKKQEPAPEETSEGSESEEDPSSETE
ncbi:ribosome biogenesis protein SSF1/2 [Nematocida sp. AWRm77]|nr:ribosome biogenesis protein SSF1/2 [Nematocida sp. AWRm77]